MDEHARRLTDGLIDEMHADIKDMRNDIKLILQNVNDLCVRISKAETRMDSMQREICEHKSDHKWNVAQATAIASIVAAVASGAFVFLVHH